MTRSVPTRDRWLRRVAPLLVALMALSFLAIGVHQHHDTITHDHCTVCTASHLPGAEGPVLDAPAAPRVTEESLEPGPETAVPAGLAVLPSSRAPPTA